MRPIWTVAFAVYIVAWAVALQGCAAKRPPEVQEAPADAPAQGAPSVEDETGGAASADDIGALRAKLTASEKQVAGLRAEIEQMRALEAAPASGGDGAKPEVPVAGAVEAGGRTDGGLVDRVARLTQEVAAERRRRDEVEAELTRLKAETSAPPFSRPDDDIDRLRRELDRERAERRRLARDLDTLKEESAAAARARPGTADGASADVQALRARLVSLETRQQEAMVSMSRTLAADRKREEELTAQIEALQAARVASGSAGHSARAVAAAEAQSAQLQSRLDEERRRNAELAAKLKLASRVADLIFRIQSGPVSQSQP